jgi:hypothetical protein
MSRWKAAGLHLLVSLLVAILTGSVVYFAWYPQPYFEVAGGSTLMLVIMGVDVVIGPLLTLIVFRRGKKGLRFDLTVIAVLQAVAFGYGVHVIAEARPAFVVAAVDRFVIVAANQLEDVDLAAGAEPEFRSRSWLGPRLVGAVPPQNGDEGFDSVMSALAGKDIDRFPKYFVPYAQVAETLLAHSQPLANLMNRSEQDAKAVQHLLATNKAEAADYRALPLQGPVATFTMVISAKDGRPIGALAINPWASADK